MGITTGIQWANATWNPFIGCKKVSPGCKNCYAERDMERYGKNFTSVVRSRTTFDAPLVWARNKKLAPGSRIFTCSVSDFFISQADPWREEAWSIIRRTPEFVYLILTKRPERFVECLPGDWGSGYPNVWLGVSAENQMFANERITILVNTPAMVRWVSAEPLLAPITFRWAPWHRIVGSHHLDGLKQLSWIVTGGESDNTTPRPMSLDWIRAIRDECQEAGVALFHKQHGGKKKIDGAWGGRVLDDMTWNQMPGFYKNALTAELL